MNGDPTSTDGFPGFVVVIGVVFGLFFLALLGFIIFSIVKNALALKRAGLDPITAESQLAGKLANSQLIAPKSRSRNGSANSMTCTSAA